MPRQAFDLVRHEPAGRPGTLATTLLPVTQPVGGRDHRAYRVVRVEQPVVAVRLLLDVQVLPHQSQPQLTGEAAGAVAEAGRGARLPLVTRLVEDGGRQLAVVRPPAAGGGVAAPAAPPALRH